MRRMLWGALACLCVLASCVPVEAPAPAIGGEVVALVPMGGTDRRLATAAGAGGYALRSSRSLPGLGLDMLTFALPEGVSGPAAIDALEAVEPRASVGLNHIYRLQQAAGGRTFEYASALMDWPSEGCVALAPVGLIDTGVDPRAVASSSARVIARRFAPGASLDARHGTEVATVLAHPARLRNAVIYSADVVRDTRSGGEISDAATMIQALDWLVGEGVRVINLSLAGPYNKLLNLAVEAAAGRGVILVAAAGNAGPRAAPQFPAGFDPVIAVTAVDAAREIYTGAVRGPHIDVAAPGVDVFVALGGQGRFVTGTSIAAPFVTARILADADLLAAPTIAELRGQLAARSEDLGPVGADPLFGAGLIMARDLCPG
ncbi:MAG: S8 family serine peptidase [Pseudomonadota bacterium]